MAGCFWSLVKSCRVCGQRQTGSPSSCLLQCAISVTHFDSSYRDIVAVISADHISDKVKFRAVSNTTVNVTLMHSPYRLTAHLVGGSALAARLLQCSECEQQALRPVVGLPSQPRTAPATKRILLAGCSTAFFLLGRKCSLHNCCQWSLQSCILAACSRSLFTSVRPSLCWATAFSCSFSQCAPG